MLIKKLWNSVRRWLGWLALLALAVVAGVWFWRATIAPTPTAFYTPPDPLPAGPPGTIIRREPLTDGLPEGAVAWRILYLSTGLNGEPIAVSGVVVALGRPAPHRARSLPGRTARWACCPRVGSVTPKTPINKPRWLS
ncbi:MAG: hypothetical protein U0401_35235 [Anaerolineae bacterium]